MTRSIHLAIVAGDRDTGQTVEVAASMTFEQLAECLVGMGYRLVSGPRGKAAVERLH